MKIHAISDIHGDLITIPTCDVLCICGDIMPLNCQRDIEASRNWLYKRFTDWVNKQSCKKVIFTPGNHDFIFENAYKKNYYNELKQDLSLRTNGKLEILINESYEYGGKKFFGCPYIQPIPFQGNKWAFQDDYTGKDKMMECVYAKIAEDADIILTHDNPLKNLTMQYVYTSKVLMTAISHKYEYWFCGHWHDGESNEKDRIYNCSLLNDMYNRKENFNGITVDTDVIEEPLTEDEIPLPITGDIIDEVADEKDED